MDKYHRDIVHKAVKQAAANITGLLPDHPSLPEGRIPVAHIYSVILAVMGKPSRECSNDRLNDILEIIQFCVDNVKVMDVSPLLVDKYLPEPKEVASSLEAFF